MSSPARVRESGRRRKLPWVVLAIVVAGILLLPVLVASTVTSEPEGSEYVRKPWLGWSFMARVMNDAFSAKAASPGAALEQATQQFDEPISVSSVELAYIPSAKGITMDVLTQDGESTVSYDPERPLVWQVYGTWSGSEATGVVGLLDFTSGLLVWDVRTDISDGDDSDS